ncbi:hypothetical protein ACFYW1_00840 [Streptomyces sp. NPDC002669]|uniref:hypothetical protein n=1 Tax=Streptomyces sp. NPDC002669 TaxID=3364658 RepID=UPI003676C977
MEPETFGGIAQPVGRRGVRAAPARLSGMKKLCETVGFLFCVLGIAGLLNEWFDRFRFLAVVRRLDFIGPYAIFVNIVLIVAGVAMMVAADRIEEQKG